MTLITFVFFSTATKFHFNYCKMSLFNFVKENFVHEFTYKTFVAKRKSQSQYFLGKAKHNKQIKCILEKEKN